MNLARLPDRLTVALAAPRVARSREHGLGEVERQAREAAGQRAAVVCFPDAYLPGLRGQDFEVGCGGGGARRCRRGARGARRLLGVIAKLPLEQRVVLGLAVGDELPHAEIASILGVPEGTVSSRLHAARECLRVRLERR